MGALNTFPRLDTPSGDPPACTGSRRHCTLKSQVGISPGGGGTRISRFTPCTGVHLVTYGNHQSKGVMPPHLWDIYRGRAEARDETDDDMVVSGRGT